MKKKIMLLGLILILILFPREASNAASANKTAQTTANVVLFAYLSGSDSEADSRYFDANSDKSGMNNGQRIIDFYEGSQQSSLKNYINTISYGQLNVKNYFPQYDSESGTLTPLALNTSKSSAAGESIDATIINEIISSYPDIISGLKVDYKTSGIIDNLTVIFVGSSDSNSNVISSMYPHKAVYGGNNKLGGCLVRNYNFLSTDRLLGTVSGLGGAGSGLIIHEFLHTLGFADLYNNAYNNHSTDSSITPANPVYTWSIMGSDSRYVQWPLAYERMYYVNWINIDTITSSCTVTLDTQDKANGNQAYIIKSPLNDSEVFVIEYRKKNNASIGSKENELETSIGYPYNETAGLIVYRINNKVENLSNLGGNTGIYVFRPMEGQNGYADTPSVSVMNAALSLNNNRTTIGSSDFSKGLLEGALSFSDGSNSGIVISTTSSGNGENMLVSVTFPKSYPGKLWDSIFSLAAGNEGPVAAFIYENKPRFAVKNGSAIEVYSMENQNLCKLGSTVTNNSNVGEMELFEYNNSLYLAIYDWSKIYIYKYGTSNWALITSLECYGDMDVASYGEETYFLYSKASASGYQNIPVLARFNGNGLSEVKAISSENGICLAHICADSTGVYLAKLDYSGQTLYTYKVSDNVLTAMGNISCSSSSFDITASKGQVYLSVSDATKFKIYKGTNSYTKLADLELDLWDPSLVIAGDSIFFTYASTSSSGNTKVYKLDSKTSSYEVLGANVDSYAYETKLLYSDNYLYIVYSNSSGTKVKRNQISNNSAANPGGEDNPSGTDNPVNEDDPNSPPQEDDPQNPVNPGGKDDPQNPSCSHLYLIDKFEWSRDYSTCYAVYKCSKNSAHIERKTCMVSSLLKKTASLSSDGLIELTAVCGDDFEKVSKNIAGIGEVSLEYTSVTYNKKAQKPSVTVKDKEGNVIASDFYSLSYTSNVNVGKAKVIVEFNGLYSGLVSKNFKIIPLATKITKISKTDGKVVISWKKASGISGYEINLARDKTFKKNKKTIAVSKKTILKKQINGLKKGKTYYYRIRTYKTVKGIKYYSNWSKTVKSKI